MKKILSYILLVVILVGMPLSFANAADCKVRWNGHYTVEANCTWPGNYKVYGNIYVWDKTITIPANRTMWINLASNKITFTTGKILIDATSKIDNSVSTRYLKTKAYTAWVWTINITTCQSWFNVLNRIAPTVPTWFQWWSETTVAQNGTIQCGKP